MADFFSQFQVHPPNDFPNLGGFQQGGDSGWNTGYAGGLPPPPTKPGGYGGPVDPLLTTQPQPYQQGPGGTQPSVIGGTIGQRLNNPQPSVIGGTVGVNTGGPAQDPRLQQLLAQHQGGFFGNIAQALASPKLQALLPTLGTPAGRLALMQQQPPMGGVFGNVAQAVTSPAFQQIAQQYGNPDVAQAISGAAGNLSGGIGQPMNPSQQSGMVLMQSPDGLHMQNVPQEHVAHYTGLGATQVTGPQLTGSSYGGGNGQ
jgi:hypothetical protein